jgi:hypothetical protein
LIVGVNYNLVMRVDIDQKLFLLFGEHGNPHVHTTPTRRLHNDLLSREIVWDGEDDTVWFG